MKVTKRKTRAKADNRKRKAAVKETRLASDAEEKQARKLPYIRKW